jgi:hypothetical protein
MDWLSSCCSLKAALKMLMSEAKKDAWSVTGSNFRKIMLLVGKSHVDEVKCEDSNIITYPFKN